MSDNAKFVVYLTNFCGVLMRFAGFLRIVFVKFYLKFKQNLKSVLKSYF